MKNREGLGLAGMMFGSWTHEPKALGCLDTSETGSERTDSEVTDIDPDIIEGGGVGW